MARKQKLELTWVGKDERPRLEPRILIEDPALSYHATERVSASDRFDNMLIQGDNLLALKALEQEFTGKVQCIYIDPPFNTQQALAHFDDGVEHSIWLSLLRDRLQLLRSLLTPEGVLAVHIDDNELGYLIVLLDEMFGRDNRLSVVTFKQGSATGHKAINPGCVTTSNFLLLYARNKSAAKLFRVHTARERDPRYSGFVVDRSADLTQWRFVTLNKAFAASRGIPEREARKLADYDALMEAFVLNNADNVIRTARPDYDAIWFRPGKRDLRIFWSADAQYVPDFVVETADLKLVVEIKNPDQMDDVEVLQKAASAEAWCRHASAHTASYGGKPWRYVLLADADVVATADLAGILARRGSRDSQGDT